MTVSADRAEFFLILDVTPKVLIITEKTICQAYTDQQMKRN